MCRSTKLRRVNPRAGAMCVVVALLALLNTCIEARDSAAAPVRVMPLGDSVTAGYPFDNNGGYRAQLWKRFGASAANLDFLGSLTGGSLIAVPDRNHEGHSGFTIAKEAGVSYGGLTENMPTWLGPSVNPDVILLMIGTNDVNFDYRAATAPERLDQLIGVISDPLTGLKPQATLIVASILPIDDSKPQYRRTPTDFSRNARVLAFNSAIPGIVAAHRAAGANVHFFDMYSRFALTDLVDGLHPTVAGYNKLGDLWYEAIQSVPEPATAVSGLLATSLVVAHARRRQRSRVLRSMSAASRSSRGSATLTPSGNGFVAAA